MAKHVIFLGAGASLTSGYPLAAGLKVILSSRYAFEKYVASKINGTQLQNYLNQRFAQMSKAVALFREGGFGTVDEFSYLARKRFPQEVHEFKQLAGIILALHAPEESNGFENSDYYPFIQRLFQESAEPRNDIAILTYNYDPYLEFLLDRAYMRRQIASGKDWASIPQRELCPLNSGFREWNAKELLEGAGLCLLKLHGASVMPPQPPHTDGKDLGWLTWDDVFDSRTNWLNKNPVWAAELISSPGMFFPWELIDENGEFTTAEKFARFENLAVGNLYYKSSARTLYELCKAIWLRAQREIADAEKFSFVGLSMHKFLKQGLEFLFKKRIEKLKSGKNATDWNSEIILACPGAWRPGQTFDKAAPPSSPAAKLVAMLNEVNPAMAKIETKGIYSRDFGKNASGGVVGYGTFRDFIEAEL